MAPSDPTGPAPAPPSYTDRYTGLCIFGVMQIIVGAVVAMQLVASVLFFTTSKSIPRLPEGKVSTVLLVNFFFGLAVLAIVLIVLGIGAMRARRWAWALNLILSWFAVLMSAVLAVMSWVNVPQDEHGRDDLSAPLVLSLGVIASMVFHLFYRDKDVELTCRRRDPLERWTDRRPLPVIAAALFALWTAKGLLMNLVPSSISRYGPVLTGFPATALSLSEAGAEIYAAVAMFKGRISGWWAALVAEVATMAFLVLKVERSSDRTWTSLVMPVAYLIFLLWLRHHFPRKGSVGYGSTSRETAPRPSG